MQEIEVKAKLKNREAVIEKLKSLGCTIGAPIIQKDRVYIHKDIGFKDITIGTPVLRIREQGDKTLFTYKSIQGDELHKKEYEVEVSSASEIELTEIKNADKVQKELFGFLESIGVDPNDRVYNGYDVMLYNKANGTDIER